MITIGKDGKKWETNTFEKMHSLDNLKRKKSLKNQIRTFLYNHVKQNITPNRFVKIKLKRTITINIHQQKFLSDSFGK